MSALHFRLSSLSTSSYLSSNHGERPRRDPLSWKPLSLTREDPWLYSEEDVDMEKHLDQGEQGLLGRRVPLVSMGVKVRPPHAEVFLST
jgi:hypothetical protein